MKYFIALIGCFMVYCVSAQVADDFSDGNFVSNPIWSGDGSDFIATGLELQLSASAAGDSYLSTAQTAFEATTWDFLVTLSFSPSNSNNVKIYLSSDQSDLSQSLNGYYIRIGENLSGDVIRFYRQDDDGNEVLLF